MTNLGIPLTPRVEACLACGDVETLYPLLATWSAPELHALERELRNSFKAGMARLDQEYQAALAQSERLFSDIERRRVDRQMLDTVHSATKSGLAAVFSEIHEVIEFYLKRTPETPQ
jgi:hypothetical protein